MALWTERPGLKAHKAPLTRHATKDESERNLFVTTDLEL